MDIHSYNIILNRVQIVALKNQDFVLDYPKHFLISEH